MKTLRSISIVALSLLIGLTSTIGVKAEGSEIYTSDDGLAAVQVVRTANEDGLSISMHADEESETIVESIFVDETEAEKLGSHTFLHLVGSEGNYKVTVKYSNAELLEEENREFTFELKVNSDEFHIEDAAEGEELDFYFPETDTIEKVNLQARNVTTRAGHKVSIGKEISGPNVRITWNKDSSFYWESGGGQYQALFVDGRIAYCIEPMVNPVSSNTAGATTLDSVSSVKIMNGYPQRDTVTSKDRELMTLYANYGFGYEGHNSDNYRWATQVLIWEARNHSVTGGKNVSAEKANIKKLVARHKEVPSWDGKKFADNKVGDIVTLDDKSLDMFEVEESPGLTIVEKSGTKLRVRIDRQAASLKLVKKQGIGTGVSMVYSDGYSQKVAEFKLSNPVKASASFEVTSHGITLRKLDTNGNRIPNTVFELSTDKNNIYGTYTTNKNGIARVEGLKPGVYYVREKSVPSPLVIDREWKKIDSTTNSDVTFTATNDIAQGKIAMKKTNEAGDLIQGTKYEVKDSNGKVVDTITTNAQGIATSKALPLGNYEVVEVFTPAPLLLDPTPIKVEISYQGQDVAVVVENATQVNKEAKGQITVDKKDIYGAAIDGVQFAVRDSKGQIVDRIKTNGKGQAVSKELPLGTYTLHEITTRPPFVLDTTPHTVEIKYADQTTPVVGVTREIINTYQRSFIEFKKVENNWDQLFPENNGRPLEGAHIEIYANEDIYEGTELIYKKDELVHKGITDKTGVTRTSAIPLGQYYGIESKAPEGYQRFTGRWTFNVEYSEDSSKQQVTITEAIGENETIYGKARLVKHDEKWTLLEGATFGVFTKEGEKITELKSNFAGRIITPELRYGEYYFQEIEAPEGYWLDSTKIPFTISEQDEIVELTAPNYKIKAKLFVHKTDSETNLPLEGAKFKIWDVDNNDWVSIKYVDGKEVIVKDEWITDEDGEFLMEATIPYGTYRLVETEAPEGYNLADPIEFKLDKNQDYVELDVIGTVLNHTVPNRPIRSDVAVAKVDKNTGDYLPGFKFKLTNIATDEETIVETDKDGIALFEQFKYGRYMVEEIEVAGEYLIDKTPQFVDIIEDSIVYELEFQNEQPVGELLLTKVDFKDGTPIADAKYGLFNLKDEIVMEDVTDSKGQITFKEIPLGEYYVKELETPEGYVLDENEYHVSVKYIDDVTPVIHLEQDVKEWRVPEIGTSASFVEREKLEPNIITLVDVVRYENLVPGREYVAEGYLMNKETNEPILIDGEKVTGRTEFVAETIDGSVNVEFTFDQNELKTDTVVVFEDLYEGEIVVAVHHDINDKDQTVRIPGIGTEASFVEIDKEEPNIATIVDEVRYENLIVGEEYEVTGVLMDKETNEPILIDGEKVTGKTTFVAENSNGIVEVEFTLDLNELKTDTVVVFEDLYNGERLIAVHHDINDKDQTVRIPEVGTTASFVESDKAQPEMITLVDEVRYENLIPGKEYTVEGHLMDKVTGEAILIDGELVTGSTTFVAVKSEGIVEVEFTFDRTKLQTKSVVVFEDLYEEDRLVAIHHDINDEGQTVDIPEIGTSASFVERDKINPDMVTIVDEVRYENLIVGEEYRVEGFLMDKETNEPIIIDGEKVYGEAVFTPEEANGSVEVEFTFDQNKLKTETVVVFEDLYNGERLIAVHHDINDHEQTVDIPKIGTTASFAERDEKEPNMVTIVDEVKYDNLIVGEEYTVNGQLMDKETGLPILIDGELVTGSTTFVAEESSGVVTVEFTFDQNKLKTDTIVVFEDLMQGERLIAVHHDIEDKDQTIEIIELEIVKKDSKTKESIEGVEFSLFTKDGILIDKQVTDKNGKISFRVVRGEQVVIKETSTPEGYIAEDVEIVVDTNDIDGQFNSYEVLNTPITPEKPTGDMRKASPIAIAVTLLGALWFFTRKKEEY